CRTAPRRAQEAVKAGRRPPPQAAQCGLDGREHGATLNQIGSYHPRLWENVWDEAADALCFPARQLGCRIDRLTQCGSGRGDQVLIAAISGPTPNIVIIRFRL